MYLIHICDILYMLKAEMNKNWTICLEYYYTACYIKACYCRSKLLHRCNSYVKVILKGASFYVGRTYNTLYLIELSIKQPILNISSFSVTPCLHTCLQNPSWLRVEKEVILETQKPNPVFVKVSGTS